MVFNTFFYKKIQMWESNEHEKKTGFWILIITLLTTVMVNSTARLTPVSGSSGEIEEHYDSNYLLNTPTEEEIRAYFNEKISFFKVSQYSERYSLEPPYAPGKLSDETLQDSLNALNFCRFIAGLPADVELYDEFTEAAQAGSLLNAVNHCISHEPENTHGLSNELFSKGYFGCSRSDLGMGYKNIPMSIFKGYMGDSDDENISRVGHRRWILNPQMKYTGFGYVGDPMLSQWEFYTATYAIDRSRTENFIGDFICWPAQKMPYEIYELGQSERGYAFSVTLGSSYDVPSLDAVTVDIRSEKLQKSWHLDQNDQEDYSHYLNVENSFYGIPKCIIFNVGSFPEDDTVSVSINGITKHGSEAPISYTVQFFKLIQKDIKPSEEPEHTDQPGDPGNTEEPEHTDQPGDPGNTEEPGQPGEIFEDGKINNKDLLKLQQYLAGWNLSLSDSQSKAADVFQDGKINNKDLLKLQQYLAGWKIELNKPDTDSGTEAENIYTVEDLIGIENNLSGNYRLMNDLELTSVPCIGDEDHPFTGTFDGNEHSIRYENVSSHAENFQESDIYAGLFAYAKNAIIKNLTICGSISHQSICESACITYIGGICGDSDQTEFRNCINNANVSIDVVMKRNSVNGIAYAGGICGCASDGLIYRCTNTGNIIGSANTDGNSFVYCGGICGGVFNGLSLSACINKAEIMADARSSLVYVSGTSLPSVNAVAGGIAGRASDASLRDSSNYGNITSSSNAKKMGVINLSAAGGIIGEARNCLHIDLFQKDGEIKALGDQNFIKIQKGEIIGRMLQ